MEYHKIQSVFKRHQSGPHVGKFIEWDYSRDEFFMLRTIHWDWTEKLDGTNMRISTTQRPGDYIIQGRTDRAQLNPRLVDYIKEHAPQEKIVEVFNSGGGVPARAVLFGEGVGPKIQKGGGRYGDKPFFVLFDVAVYTERHGWFWLGRDTVNSIADKLGIAAAPVVFSVPIHLAVEVVRQGIKSRWGDFQAEGVVGRPIWELRDRLGSRIITKIKTTDFVEE